VVAVDQLPAAESWPIALTSCGQRQAVAIFVAHSKAASREGTSIGRISPGYGSVRGCHTRKHDSRASSL
jgi:hypothetical protein